MKKYITYYITKAVLKELAIFMGKHCVEFFF